MKRKVDERLDEIYSQLPSIKCKGLCQEACGPLGMTKDEFRRLSEAIGKPAWFDHETLKCSALGDDGKCSAYEVRPMICRLFGLVKAMACPYGCEPERWLSQEEADQLLAKTDKVTGRKGPVYTHEKSD